MSFFFDKQVDLGSFLVSGLGLLTPELCLESPQLSVSIVCFEKRPDVEMSAPPLLNLYPLLQ